MITHRNVVVSVCLSVCPIIAQEPIDRFASDFDWGTWQNHGNPEMFLTWLRDSKLSWMIFKAKILFPSKSKRRGGSNFEDPEQRCVPILVWK